MGVKWVFSTGARPVNSVVISLRLMFSARSVTKKCRLQSAPPAKNRVGGFRAGLANSQSAGIGNRESSRHLKPHPACRRNGGPVYAVSMINFSEGIILLGKEAPAFDRVELWCICCSK